MFNKIDYEKLGESLQTSEEILYAIERVTGCDFKMDECGHYEINAAYELWENGGRENDILDALPIQNGGSPIEDGAKVFWGMGGKFAEFDGEK